MSGSFWHLVSNLVLHIVPLICSGDYLLAKQLGLSDWQFAFTKAGLFLIALSAVLVAWYRSWPRLRRNGFSKKVWRWGLYLLFAFTAFQIAKILGTPIVGDVFPCPYDIALMGILASLTLYALYFYHLGLGNKGSFLKFFGLVVTPLFGEVALNTREASATGVRLLFQSAEVTLQFGAHLLGMLRA